jgi:hypothetical protein
LPHFPNGMKTNPPFAPPLRFALSPIRSFALTTVDHVLGPAKSKEVAAAMVVAVA